MRKSLKIAFISPLMTSSNINQVSNCANILSSFSEKIFVILSYETPIILNEAEYTCTINIIHKSANKKIERIFGYVLTQIKIAKQLSLIRNKISTCFFFMGDGLVIPIIISKILNMKVILLLGGSYEEVVRYNNSRLYKAILLLRQINLNLSDCIIVYSPILIKKWNLEKYINKIFIAHEHYIEPKDFRVINQYNNRNMLIGYIGHLDDLKGVFNFVRTFPEILRYDNSIRFLIGGTGLLEEKIRQYCSLNELNEYTDIIGWIPHNELIFTLNDLSLLVLPSNSEGLPNIVLEAMSCGTPVLATPVGAIPDIIKDGETGFIMENNSIECIQKNIVRILECKDLDKVSKNAENFIKNEFNYNETVKIFQKVFS